LTTRPIDREAADATRQRPQGQGSSEPQQSRRPDQFRFFEISSVSASAEAARAMIAHNSENSKNLKWSSLLNETRTWFANQYATR